MTLLMPQIAARVFDTPLLVAPEKAVAFLVGFGGRLVDGGVTFANGPSPSPHVAFSGDRIDMGVVGNRLGRTLESRGARPYPIYEGVAVIAVEGTLVHKGGYVGQSSGETSCEGLQAQIAMAGRDPLVKGVVFEVDSLGGESAGIPQTGAMIAALSEAKPTMAILTDASASAAYWLTAPCRQVVMPKLGVVGSIGALIIHLNVSAKMETDGVVATLIQSGARKTEGYPFAALSDQALAARQSRVDLARDTFAEAVGRGRGKRMTKAAALATEAGMFDGPEALRLGLVDAVSEPNDAFEAFVKAVNRA